MRASPPSDSPDVRECWRRRAARWALLVAAVFLVIFLRSPSVLLLPSLEAEDGTYVFQHFYANRGAAEILRFKSGYVPLVANLIAYASVRLPAPATPYLLAWVPLLVTLAAYTWLFGARYRPWLGSDATRATLCVLFALAPLSQWHLLAHTDYSIWNTLMLVLLVAAGPDPRAAWARYAAWALANLLVWSHPLSIIAAPLVAVRLVRDRGGRALYAATLANIAAYQALGVERAATLAGLGVAESLGSIAGAAGTAVSVAAYTAFRTAFGAPAYAWASARSWAPVAAWGALLLCAIVVAARRSRRLRTVFAALLYVVFGVTLLSVLSRRQASASLNEAPRYVYLQSLALLAIFVLLADRLAASLAGGRRWARAAALGGLLAVYLLLNAQLGHFFVANGRAARPSPGAWSPYLQAHPDNGPIVRDFFRELGRLEREAGSHRGIRLAAEKKNDWPIVVDTREP